MQGTSQRGSYASAAGRPATNLPPRERPLVLELGSIGLRRRTASFRNDMDNVNLILAMGVDGQAMSWLHEDGEIVIRSGTAEMIFPLVSSASPILTFHRSRGQYDFDRFEFRGSRFRAEGTRIEIRMRAEIIEPDQSSSSAYPIDVSDSGLMMSDGTNLETRLRRINLIDRATGASELEEILGSREAFENVTGSPRASPAPSD